MFRCNTLYLDSSCILGASHGACRAFRSLYGPSAFVDGSVVSDCSSDSSQPARTRVFVVGAERAGRLRAARD